MYPILLMLDGKCFLSLDVGMTAFLLILVFVVCCVVSKFVIFTKEKHTETIPVLPNDKSYNNNYCS